MGCMNIANRSAAEGSEGQGAPERSGAVGVSEGSGADPTGTDQFSMGKSPPARDERGFFFLVGSGDGGPERSEAVPPVPTSRERPRCSDSTFAIVTVQWLDLAFQSLGGEPLLDIHVDLPWDATAVTCARMSASRRLVSGVPLLIEGCGAWLSLRTYG